jgi:tryptophan synthase beta chain
MTDPVDGRFGEYGGRYVPEALIAALDELTAAYEKAKTDEAFQSEFHRLLRDYAGRPAQL